MLLQALRFKYFIRHFLGYDVASTGKTVAARLAGEFVTQTTPSYVGGELVRIAWLSKNGVPPGKAAWVTTMEIIADVFVGSVLRSEEHTSELQSRQYLVCRLLLEKKKTKNFNSQ